MSPLTHTARVLPADRNQAWKAVGGAAAWPRVIISFLVAGVQVVGRDGGGYRRVFRGRGALLPVAIRDFRLPSVSGGDGGVGVRRTDPVVVQMYII